jgi:hypothetical protein
MRTFTFVALSNAVAGKEREFNDWYDTRHLNDVLSIPGFVAARRFEMVGSPVRAERPYRYLATYEVVTADPDAALRELLARLGTPSMPLSEALAQEVYAVLYEARAAPVVRARKH